MLDWEMTDHVPANSATPRPVGDRHRHNYHLCHGYTFPASIPKRSNPDNVTEHLLHLLYVFVFAFLSLCLISLPKSFSP